MKSTGIIRKLDHLGRLVIPIELRKAYLSQDDIGFEIFTDDNYIILKKHEPTCLLCNKTTNLIEFKGKLICKDCLEQAHV